MKADPEWYRTFFAGLFVEIWLRVPSAAQDREEADFIEQQLRLPPGGRVLDVPCGGGRHCHQLAARGHHMTGVDISPQFLKAAREAAAQQRWTIDWREGDMRQLGAVGDFDGAFCFGNSFGYLDDQGNADFLKAVAGALKPGGRFLLDYPAAAEALLPAYVERMEGYTGREVCRLMEDAGFADVQAFASLAGEPFRLGARGLFLAATKS